MADSILTLAAKGDASQVMRDMRVRALLSSYYFVKVVLGYSQMVPHLHQQDMELFLDRWAGGERKQLIEWPRGFFKSTSFTIGTGIWIVLPVAAEDIEYALHLAPTLGRSEDWIVQRLGLHDQDATQLMAFETIDNARKKLAEVKYHFEENELFRTLFPEIAYTGSEKPWNTDCLKIRRVGYGQRLEEGTFEAIGVGGALQSRHYRIVWEDDLIGMKATKSANGAVMSEAIRWHGLLHGAFENAAEQNRFVVGNRWGYADLNSYIRENEPDFVIHSRAAWEIGSEGQETAIFPERYSMESLMKIKDQGSMTKYDFSCQYLNDPQMPGEKEIDNSKLHTYEVHEGGLIKCSCGVSWKPSQMLRYIHYDPYNAKGGRSTSCPAIAVVGTTTDRHVVLLDYYVSKGDYGRIYDTLYTFNDRWRPSLFTYEDVGHQNMTEFHIRKTEKTAEYQQKHKRFPQIKAMSCHGKAKEIRIRDHFFPFIQQHKFAYRTTQVAFAAQLDTFPNAVLSHDYDLLDALAQGALSWRFPEAEEEHTQAKAAEEAYIAQLGQPYTHLELVQ